MVLRQTGNRPLLQRPRPIAEIKTQPMMDLSLGVSQRSSLAAPPTAEMHRWICAALKAAAVTRDVQISLSLVDSAEMTELNRSYRQRDFATNVLAFTADMPDGPQPTPLGDIIVCNAVVESEAQRYQLPVAARWAHMLIHGTLHLLGYDHQQEQQTQQMEKLEHDILLELDFPVPDHG